MNSPLNEVIVGRLDAPLDPKRVVSMDSGPMKNVPYLAGEDVIRTANDIFGYGGWSFRTKGLPQLIEEGTQGSNKTLYQVWAVSGELEVRGCGTVSDVGVNVRQGGGSGSLEMAYKGAVTDALKRCLVHFGDQFGLVLRDKHLTPEALREEYRAWSGEAAAADERSATKTFDPDEDAKPTPMRPQGHERGETENWAELRRVMGKQKLTSTEVAGVVGSFNAKAYQDWLDAHPGRDAEILAAEAIARRNEQKRDPAGVR